MPISLQCPKCGLRMKAPDTALGKRIRCKRCQEPLTIAASAPPQEEAPAAIRPTPPAKGRGMVWAVAALLLAVGLGIGGYFAWPALSSMLFDNAKSKSGTPIAQAREKSGPVVNDAKPEPTTLNQDKQPEPPAGTQDKANTSEPEPTKKAKKSAKPKTDKSKLTKDGVIPEFPDLDPSAKKGPAFEKPTRTPDGALTVAIHPTKSLRFLAVSPDGKTLYTAAWDNQLRIWDLETLVEKSAFPLPKPDAIKNSRLQAALSPDGKHVVFNHWDVLQILNLETKNVERFDNNDKRSGHMGDIRFSA